MDLEKIFYTLVILLTISLSGCLPTRNGDQEFSLPEVGTPVFTIISSPPRLPAKTPTDTPPPTWTPSSTPEPTFTHTPNPTASLTSTSFPDGYIIFEEDFESSLEGLVLEGGKSAWQIQEDENGNHFLCNIEQLEPGLNIYIRDQHWQNYQIEFDVKDIEFDFSGPQVLALRVQEKGKETYHFIMFVVSYQLSTDTFTTDTSRVVFVKALASGESKPLLETYIAEPVENQWYSIITIMDEGDISFYWDDELVIDYHDEEYLPDGAISFFVMYGNCLDNIKVTNIGKVEQ